MGEKSAVERVDAAYEKLTAANARIKSLEKKLTDGTLTMKEGAELTDLRAQAFGTAFSGKVLDIAQDERESACTELLRKRCDDTDEVAEAAQRAALSRQGLNLTPPTAPFEEDRARKIGHSLEDPTVPDETIQRRAKSATETMIRSQYDRNMKQGAKTCAEAGLKTYIIRDSASGCCKWCDEVAGKFAYGSEPKDVYRRHDNCTCTVVYESGRGRQNVWSKQYWSAEQEREYLRLREEMAPKRLNARQAAELRERVGGLTFGAKGGIIYSGSEGMYRKSKEGKKEPMPKKQFRKIYRSFKAKGGIIQMNPETDKYLESKHVEGITYNENTILLKQNPNRASVFEELIHSAQYRDGKNDGSYKSRILNEIEAQKILIKNAKAYKLTDSEIEQTKIALQGYEEELEEYYKNGGV